MIEHMFRLIAFFLFSVFMTVMIFVTFIAFTRHSGITGIDVAKMHLLRVQAREEK